jgi:segregation and condensation protein A
VALRSLDLDLQVFQGPFDLLLTLVLNEEVDLLEVDLAEVVLAYVEHLERVGELDLEATTEFLVLIAALLELKSRLMLPAEDDEEALEPGEAAEELLARMLEYRRFRTAADFLRELLAAQTGFRYRSAPLPPPLRRVSLEAASAVYDPAQLGEAIGGLLRAPPPLDLGHLARPHVSIEQRLSLLRDLLRRGSFSFDEAVRDADRLTEAVTRVALLELYKAGEADWEQTVPFGDITVKRSEPASRREAGL